jgi:hypothetical protein
MNWISTVSRSGEDPVSILPTLISTKQFVLSQLRILVYVIPIPVSSFSCT